MRGDKGERDLPYIHRQAQQLGGAMDERNKGRHDMATNGTSPSTGSGTRNGSNYISYSLKFEIT